MSDGPVFVEKVDYEAAAKAMYDADDAYRVSWDSQPMDGVKAWYRQMTRYAIEAALVGARPAEGSRVAGPDDQLATKQIEKLAQFIMDEVPGEPSQSEGAVDTAIRLLRGLPGPDDLVIRREDSIPDALVEEAAKRLYQLRRQKFNDERLMARAALSVLFPGEEEE